MRSVLTRSQVTPVQPITAVQESLQQPTVLRPQGHMNADRVLAFQDQLTRAVMSP